ncbi:hypothetical protein PHMEG_0008078 [Phytophthora megakarya]|uniref:RxLR effector protein n=1 Tax=Phytophthora megakarya TaxID=4795 RepID=A0A225WKJ1_9STRA|nr:hypothetical protein PHMEG_0008078 [Phytophthora megakarya]
MFFPAFYCLVVLTTLLIVLSHDVEGLLLYTPKTYVEKVNEAKSVNGVFLDHDNRRPASCQIHCRRGHG